MCKNVLEGESPLIKASTSLDLSAAKRAFDAMMTMKKIDIAVIEAAVRG